MEPEGKRFNGLHLTSIGPASDQSPGKTLSVAAELAPRRAQSPFGSVPKYAIAIPAPATRLAACVPMNRSRFAWVPPFRSLQPRHDVASAQQLDPLSPAPD